MCQLSNQYSGAPCGPGAACAGAAAETLLSVGLLRTASNTELLETRLNCCRFSCSGRLDLTPDVQLLTAGLDLRDDLRHDALLVNG